MNKKSLSFIILILAIFISGCSNSIEVGKNLESEKPLWFNYELKSIEGQIIKISDYEGKVVLIESFATWCPSCIRQQQELKKLHDSNPEIIIIELNTDPNEDKQTVIDHINRYNFSGNYVISPIEFTKFLIDDFGPKIVQAPSVPMILICENGDYQILKSGVKESNELIDSINTICGD